MTIPSTCHPHSQAASSSLLPNEGGGVSEAGKRGGTPGGLRGQTDRGTDAGKAEAGTYIQEEG